jgi:hypothetical protein
MNKLYKIILLCSLFLGVVLTAFTQQNHFVYIQTENKQPFYIKLNNKLLSSSASGYLIIPKLQDGSYELTIGFPKNEWSEQNVTCAVNKKDAGYLLKDFGDKGWGLFNLQTMEVAMSGDAAATNKVVIEENKKETAVTAAPVPVAIDSAMVKKNEDKPAVKEEVKPVVDEVKKETVVAVSPVPVAIDSVVIKKVEASSVIKEEVKSVVDTGKKEETKSPAPITKLLNVNTAEGAEMIYVDNANGKADTISVFIPAQKDTINAQAQPQKKQEEPKVELQNAVVQKVEEPKPEEAKIEKEIPKTTDTKFIDIILPNPNAKPDTAVKQIKPEIFTEKKVDTNAVPVPEKQKENITKPDLSNSNCKALASEDDFLKLRKKMAAETTDDDMVDAARKTFKIKCFTTSQIKNLCVLFLNDEGRYKFFDAAYPFVSDVYNFNTLEMLLTDNYFINRFKVMIRH